MKFQTATHKERTLLFGVVMVLLLSLAVVPHLFISITDFGQHYIFHQAEVLKSTSENIKLPTDNVSHPLNDTSRFSYNTNSDRLYYLYCLPAFIGKIQIIYSLYNFYQ